MSEEKKEENPVISVYHLLVRSGSAQAEYEAIDWGANTPAGVLWVKFLDGSQIVINSHRWDDARVRVRPCVFNEQGELVDYTPQQEETL